MAKEKVVDAISDQVVPAMDKLVDKISPAIATLSDKLGTTAEHLWVILVKQSYNHAIGNAIIVMFAIVGLKAAFYGANIWKKKIEDDEWHSDSWPGVVVIKIAGSVIGTLVIGTNIVSLAQKLINPEFYALQTILKYIN
jgi:hypothetical protein